MCVCVNYLQLFTSNKNSILKLCKYISEAFVMRKDFNMID